MIQNPEQILASSQMHVYATPSRVQTPDHLLVEEQQQQSQQSQFFNTRGRKSRNCNLPTTYQGLVSKKKITFQSGLFTLFK